MKLLRASNIKRCIGCNICSLTCARDIHGLVSWESSGIRIKSSGGISTGFEATFCLACKEPACLEACPTDALVYRKGGGVIFKKDGCIRCMKCKSACPVDAVSMDDSGFPVICIHCGRCVSFCPHHCLELVRV